MTKYRKSMRPRRSRRSRMTKKSRMTKRHLKRKFFGGSNDETNYESLNGWTRSAILLDNEDDMFRTVATLDYKVVPEDNKFRVYTKEKESVYENDDNY
jgi:hypothetical protein